MSVLSKILENRWLFRAFIPSLIFNFRHLSFKQACRLPILLYKPRTGKCSGRFVFNCPVRFGLVTMGTNCVSIYPNSGISLENRGTIVFNGKLSVGNASAISVGKCGVLEFGNNIAVTADLKLACFDAIEIQDNVLIGWSCMLTDTDFHRLKYTDGRESSKGYGKIVVGKDSWIANGCKLYKNAVVPPHCVVGADTIIHGAVKGEASGAAPPTR